MSEAEQRARREQEERKAQDAATKAFNAASKTAPSEDPRDGVRGQKGYAKGGKIKKMSKGGSASARADGVCVKGKTKGKFV